MSTWMEAHGFLNAPVDAVTGFIDLGAWRYDPVTGWFVSVDPVLGAKNPSSSVGYTYAGNTPVTFSDTGGHNWCADMLDDIGIGDAVWSAAVSPRLVLAEPVSTPPSIRRSAGPRYLGELLRRSCGIASRQGRADDDADTTR